MGRHKYAAGCCTHCGSNNHKIYQNGWCAICAREYQHMHQAEHALTQRRHHLAHIETDRATNQRYYQKNKVEINRKIMFRHNINHCLVNPAHMAYRSKYIAPDPETILGTCACGEPAMYRNGQCRDCYIRGFDRYRGKHG
jgi:hypothetical protein